ncbi:MAG: redoxin domain-containing protein [Halobacteriales archaeon]|nr:redoxin domain-containing protein [Halobacteriales archaeon]
MLEVGDRAPGFTAPIAGGDGYDDVDEFSLAAALEAGPVVLAFVPAAFTGWCSSELASFRDGYDAFAAVDAQVYGVSVDLPFAQNVWADELDLPFPLLADPSHELIEAYGVVREGFYDVMTVAERSVFVIDPDGEITYTWVEDAGSEPDWDALVEAVADAAAAAAEA